MDLQYFYKTTVYIITFFVNYLIHVIYILLKRKNLKIIVPIILLRKTAII